MTKFLRNELRIEPQGANLVTEAGGGVPAPKQLKNLENIDFGGLGVGGSPPPLGPVSRVYVAYAWAAYGLSEDPSLTTCFFPGRDGVGGWG